MKTLSIVLSLSLLSPLLAEEPASKRLDLNVAIFGYLASYGDEVLSPTCNHQSDSILPLVYYHYDSPASKIDTALSDWKH
jgi:hypothetical protein